MTLSNVILFHLLFKNYNNNDYLVKSSNHNQVDYNKTVGSVSCNLNRRLFNILAKPNNVTNVDDLFKFETNKDFISRNFWQKLVNKYWQETIFISTSNSLSDNYITKLKSAGLSVYKGSDYKLFLMNFSRNLVNGNIQVSMQDQESSSIPLIFDKNNVYVKYKWFKFLRFRTKFISFGLNRLSSNYILKKSKSLPLFTLINKNYQIVMSESSENLLKNKKFFNLTIKFFNIFSMVPQSSKKLYTGLLFVNPEDSLEYKNYIESHYNKSTRVDSVQSILSNLDLYYELLNSSVDSAEIRLIPDLKELSDLIYKYRKYKHLSFDESQKYGSNYFQGQPIYIIKSSSVKNSNTQRHEIIDYLYHIRDKQFLIKYQPVFLNYESAINAWHKFRQEHQYYKLPCKPQIYVSNLESFVRTSHYRNNYNRIVFIPSFQTYKFMRQLAEQKAVVNFPFKQFLTENIVHLKSLFFRVAWSLTSRQPVNW